jgi:hypothetical protein
MIILNFLIGLIAISIPIIIIYGLCMLVTRNEPNTDTLDTLLAGLVALIAAGLVVCLIIILHYVGLEILHKLNL